LHNRDMKKREIATKEGMDPATSVGIQPNDPSVQNGARRYCDSILNKDRIEQSPF